MQLKHVIHPEVVLGRRGNPASVKIYQELIRNVTVDSTSGVHLQGLALTLKNDESMLEHLVLCKMYKQRGRAFYLPGSFAQALSKVDRALPVSVLPDRFLGYFHFGNESLQDDFDYVEGGYVYIGPANDIGLKVMDGPPDTKVAALSYVNKPDSNGVSAVGRFTFTLARKTMLDAWNSCKMDDSSLNREEVGKARLPIYRALINAAIYVHSADPDLVKLPAEQELSNKKRSALREKTGVENLCTVPITVLNKSYHQGKTYSVDSTMVSGHLRWQPCGEGRTQTKLIWINEHERKYH